MAVERFDVKTCMMSEKKGEYVSYKNYEALLAINSKLKQILRDIKQRVDTDGGFNSDDTSTYEQLEDDDLIKE